MKNGKFRLPIPPTDVITVLVSTAAIFFVLAFGSKLLEGYRLQRYNAALRAELDALQDRHEELEARLDYVQTPEYVEKVAREQYKWAKAGEKLVITLFRKRPIVVETPTPIAQSTSATGTATTSAASHWPEWWQLLAAGSFD